MNMDMKILRDYEARGLIRLRPRLATGHHYLVANYTPECAYSGAWDEITRVCRGLVLRPDGRVIGNSMPKFFNLGQPEVGEIPAEVPQIWEKADGVLAIVFWDDEVRAWDVTSRGNPESEFSVWARAFLARKGIRLNNLDVSKTYLAEMISPISRIVVDYGGREELRLLAVRNTQTGEEFSPEYTRSGEDYPAAHYAGFTINRRFRHYETTPADRLAEDMAEPNAEGFVLFYPRSGLRVKVKFADYVALHRSLTGLSTKSVWEALKAGKTLGDLFSVLHQDSLKWWAAEEWKALEQLHHAHAVGVFLAAQEINREATARGWNRQRIWEECGTRGVSTAGGQDILMAAVGGKTEVVHALLWKMERPEFRRPGHMVELEQEST